MNDILKGCEDISIYLGNTCNFECTYCDRDYIKDTIGGQMMTDVDEIMTFLNQVTEGSDDLQMISFHGGEPFVYVKVMDEIIERCVAELGDTYKFFIQTNGSLIVKNDDFIKKWGERLIISISYDFMYQGMNRTDFDVVEATTLLHGHGISDIQYQYVMPIDEPSVFSFKSLMNIINVCRTTKVYQVNLIPLRHIRGKDKFKVIVDQIDLNQFFGAFIEFIQMLYIQKIIVTIDGHSRTIDKDYFANHKQLVISPDGFIYPEYDFLEYKVESTRIGQWRTKQINVTRESDQEDNLINEKCQVCPAKPGCGLKFLYSLFEKEPGESCKTFYTMMDVIIKHNIKLKQEPNLFKWIGI